MPALHDHPAEPLPVAGAHAHHGHAHHDHAHHRHFHAAQASNESPHHHPEIAHEHRAVPELRFSLIALSALQRLVLVAPAIVALGLLALWATQNG